jgi:Leucine-rich repeat (LRR) protein
MGSSISPRLPPLESFSFDRQEKGNKENSFEVQERQNQTSTTLQAACKKSPSSLDSMPRPLLSHILLMAGESPSNIVLVSRNFNHVQSKTYSKFLSAFAADPRFRFCTKGLSRGSILKMTDDEHRNRFKKIRKAIVWGAKETGIIPFQRRKKPMPLTFHKLAKSAKRIQRIRDEDLIVFHDFLTMYLLQNKIAKRVQQPNCLGIENKAAWIREWMNSAKRKLLLLHVQEVDLENRGLRTIPIEISRCKKVERLYLASNQITIVRIEILNLREITILDLDDNRIRWVNNIERLVNLLDLELASNKLKVIHGLNQLNNLERLSFADNTMKKMPLGIETLPNLEEIDFANNPFSYEESFLCVFLSSMIKTEITHAKREEYYQALQKFLSSLSSDNPTWPIHDQIAEAINSFEDPIFRHHVHQTFLSMTLWEVYGVLESARKGENPIQQQLPIAVINRILFIYNKLEYGTASELPPSSFYAPTLETALQAVALELAFVHLGKKHNNRDYWEVVFTFFHLLDPLIQETLLRHLNSIVNSLIPGGGENSPIQVEMDSFTNLQSKLITNDYRIEAIERTIKEIAGEEAIPNWI